MIEVEAKVKISRPEKYKKLAAKLGNLVEKTEKIDSYYTLENLKTYPKKSLRIRKINNHYEINFKQKISYVKGVHAKDEQEFIVSDIKNFLRLIKDFGFKKWLTKEKHSEIYEINPNFHIELNSVKSLGWFVEVEYLTTKNNISNARAKVIKTIKKLNLSEKKITKDGYTKMLWDKKNQ